jgi:translation initiation factor SUI1
VERGRAQRRRAARGFCVAAPLAPGPALPPTASFFHAAHAPTNTHPKTRTSHSQGLEKGYDYKKVLKAFKKEFCCNGTVVEDPELGQVIQLQGDQRKNASTFLVENKLVKKGALKIHGF